MIDIANLRERRDELGRSLARRGVEVDLDALFDLDERRRESRADAEDIRSKQNTIGRSIPGLDGDEKQQAISKAGELAEKYKTLLASADDLDELFDAQWVTLPNMTDLTAADGLEEADAVELRRVGERPSFAFEAKDHVDLGVGLDIVDIERAVKISGSD